MLRSLTCIIFVTLCSAASLFAQNSDYSFASKQVDLGTVKKGESKASFFEFTNTGKEDLIIELVSSCECTSLSWTRGPITPGSKGRIDFVFDSSKKDLEETIDVDLYFRKASDTESDGYFEILNYKYKFAD